MGLCASTGRSGYNSPASYAGTPASLSRASSANYGSGPSSPTTDGGNQITSIYQLSEKERRRFLKDQDPMQMYNLNHNTPLYRTMPAEYLQNGYVTGNPNSGALIHDHEHLRPNPFGGFKAGTSKAYWPVIRDASEMGPSLNVMVGPDAHKSLRGYHRDGNVKVKMRLGDFLDCGGKVYGDHTAAKGDRIDIIPLIVTLPEGHAVPAEQID